MIKNTILIILFLNTVTVFSQVENNVEILKADSTWTKEKLKMPLGFAQDIKYEGIEDIRFAKGWSKKDSPGFWTYTFAWYIKGIQKQTVENLERHLKLYFDGLMLPANNEEQKLPGATVLFIDNPNDSSSFIGKVKTYDRFHTQEVISLNCTVKRYYCETKNTSTVMFRFSIKPFEDDIWNKLKQVKVIDSLCEN